MSVQVRDSLLQGRYVSIKFGCTLFHPEDIPHPEEWKGLVHPTSKTKKSRAKKKKKLLRALHRGRKTREYAKNHGVWRRAVRSKTSPRPCLPTRANIEGKLQVPAVDPGTIPSLEDLMRSALHGSSSRSLFGLTQDFIVDIMKMKSAPSFCTEESAKSTITGFSTRWVRAYLHKKYSRY